MAERPSREQVDNAIANTEARGHEARSSWTEKVLAAEVRALREELAAMEELNMGGQLAKLRETLARVEGLPTRWRKEVEYGPAVLLCTVELEKALKGE